MPYPSKSGLMNKHIVKHIGFWFVSVYRALFSPGPESRLMQRVIVKLSATKIKRPSVRAAQAVLVPAKGALCQTRALPIVLVSAILIARKGYRYGLVWFGLGR